MASGLCATPKGTRSLGASTSCGLSSQSLAAVNYAVRILLVRLPAYLRVHELIGRPDRTAPLRQRDDLIQQKFFGCVSELTLRVW
jgi:hypothetical protein